MSENLENRENEQMEQDKYVTIPLYVHEKQLHRLYKIIRMLVIVIIVVFLTFAGYVFYESQFEVIRIEQEASADGDGRALLNGTGEMTYNASESETDNNDTP